MNRKHLVHPAGEPTLGPGSQDMGFKISMSAASAISEGEAPYFAPGMALPYDGYRAKQAPYGVGDK
eukprot:2228851-Karenia_brevis.AAC.1